MHIDPSDLIAFLAIARGRTYAAAAASLGVNQTTIARRRKSLERQLKQRLLVSTSSGWELTNAGNDVLLAAEAVERALQSLNQQPEDSSPHRLVQVSSTATFEMVVAAPALQTVRKLYPRVRFELLTNLRPAPTYGPTYDIEVGPTKPSSKRVAVTRLGDFELGLFASRQYLADRPAPTCVEDLADHVPVYYIESLLQIEHLNLVESLFSVGSEVIGATNVATQMELTKLGLGIGILSVYWARRHDDLVRVLPTEVGVPLSYWMTARTENLRRPEVRVVAEALERRARQVLQPPGRPVPESTRPIEPLRAAVPLTT